MKISPEPLAPLRNWRELWQVEPLEYESGYREPAGKHLEAWKTQKRTGFTWIIQLFGRNFHR